MAKRSGHRPPQPRSSVGTLRYFDRLREELAGYADGVHLVGSPITETALAEAATRWGAPLPSSYVELLRSWNGLELFQESLTIYGLGAQAIGGDAVERTQARHEVARSTPRLEGALLIGEAATGELYWLAPPDGAVLEVEDELVAPEGEGTVGSPWLLGSAFEPCLNALMAGHKLLVDREGEFREDIFGEDGELTPATELKRQRRMAKVDPGSAASWYRLGKALLVAQQARGTSELLDEACDALRRAAALDPLQPWGWYDLGRTLQAAGDGKESITALERAARAETARDQAAFFAAVGAWVAVEGGQTEEASRLRQLALELDPAVGRYQRDAGRAELEEGHPAEALERLSIAKAILPTDLETLALLARLKPLAP